MYMCNDAPEKPSGISFGAGGVSSSSSANGEPAAKKPKLHLNNSTAHDEVLLELIAEAVNNSAKNKGKGTAVISDVGQISDVDLCLFCAEPSKFVGAKEDFVFSA